MPPCITTRCRSGVYRVWICSSWPRRTWKSWECIRSDTRSSYWRLWRNSALWWGRRLDHVCLCTVCVHSSALCIQEAMCWGALDIYWAVIFFLSGCGVVQCSDIRAGSSIYSTIALFLEPALVCTVEPAAVGQIQPEYTTALIAIQVLFHSSALRALGNMQQVRVHCLTLPSTFISKPPVVKHIAVK